MNFKISEEFTKSIVVTGVKEVRYKYKGVKARHMSTYSRKKPFFKSLTQTFCFYILMRILHLLPLLLYISLYGPL